MISRTLARTACAIAFAVIQLNSASVAAPDQQLSDIGLAQIHAKLVTVEGNLVTMKTFHGEAEHYAFSGALLHAYRASGGAKGSALIDRADASGDAKSQLKLTVESVADGTKNIVFADKLTYVHDASGATDGTLTFVGHVKVETHYAKALAKPSTTTFDTMTVVMGKKPDYPKISGENMNGDFTFLRGNE